MPSRPRSGLVRRLLNAGVRRQNYRCPMEVGMISRQWRGLVRADQAQNYVRHLRCETFPALREITGFLDASILSRPFQNGIEFLVVTRWAALGGDRQLCRRRSRSRGGSAASCGDDD